MNDERQEGKTPQSADKRTRGEIRMQDDKTRETRDKKTGRLAILSAALRRTWPLAISFCLVVVGLAVGIVAAA